MQRRRALFRDSYSLQFILETTAFSLQFKNA